MVAYLARRLKGGRIPGRIPQVKDEVHQLTTHDEGGGGGRGGGADRPGRCVCWLGEGVVLEALKCEFPR